MQIIRKDLKRRAACFIGIYFSFWTPCTFAQSLVPIHKINPSVQISALGLSPNGNSVALGGEDGTVKVYNIQTGQLLTTLDGHRGRIQSLSFGFNKKSLVVCSVIPGWKKVTIDPFSLKVKTREKESIGEIKTWDLLNRSQKTLLTGPSAVVASTIFSKDGKSLLFAFGDGSIGSWDGTRFIRRKTEIPKDQVSSAGFSRDGGFVAVGSRGGNLELLTIKGEKHWAAFHPPTLCSLAFSPNGEKVATGGRGIKIWDVGTGKKLVSLAGHTAGVFALAFTPDGKVLFSGSGIWHWGQFKGGEIKLWNAETGMEIGKVLGHRETVDYMALSPNGKILLTASRSQDQVIVWRYRGTQLIKGK